ncbi:hypothetical protein JOF28_002440 [Leucobacter exalbidus]|uniref:5-bromo-4-chloroindolyl phosphate hydrolysis protein n=1 Tax=Leucobacter exalbidus TaxID=662960 RepID=A0A940PUS0_9MICO|nr:hypothetical protein [Leucobacter exalbidus]MBP1327208.1 hypothetical protein [Leucobacter exalbidus]
MTPLTFRRIRQIATSTGGLIVVVVIVWLDVATGVWQDLVILSGLAAGLVTFVLTVLVLGRIVDRNSARRWAPINRLAITEFLHAIVDDEASEIALGEFVPRTLDLSAALAEGPAADGGHTEAHLGALEHLREQVVTERRALSDALSRWTAFLASSGDNEDILRHIANIALQLDLVRDAALEFERQGSEANYDALRTAVETCNRFSAQLIDELRKRLVLTDEHRAGSLS